MRRRELHDEILRMTKQGLDENRLGSESAFHITRGIDSVDMDTLKSWRTLLEEILTEE